MTVCKYIHSTLIITQELLLWPTLLHCMDHGPIMVPPTTHVPALQPSLQAVEHATYIILITDITVMQMIMLEYGA